MPEKERLSALLSLGYFPKELPLVFTTLDFGRHSSEIIAAWRKANVFKTETVSYKQPGKRKKNLFGSYTYKISDTDIEVISKPKRGYERRNINITHPIPQALLAYEISTHWKSISGWLSRQTYSLDKIQISKLFDRSIRGINFDIHRAKNNFIEATSDWLVKTDITRFYPTIYTHSIPWAAYGKEKVKNNLSLYKGSLADRLDILIRNCNRNQTIGIPIGPETSRVIAEIISSRIDDDFAADTDLNNKDIDRLQDDWFIGVSTFEEAEDVLSKIARLYRNYGLEINGSKTSINHILKTKNLTWTSEITSFLAHKSGPLKGARLKEFLNLSLRLQTEFENDHVINYAMSVIEGGRFGGENVELLESFLLKAAVLSPVSMDRICRVILNFEHDTKQISKKRLRNRFTQLAERNLEKGNLYEAIWQIYTLRGLKIAINSKKISEIICTHHGSALPLILLDMKEKGLFLNSLPKSNWEDKITIERVERDWIWLLAYEGIRKGWLADKNGVMNAPFFKEMDRRDVVFYDQKKNVKKSKAERKIRDNRRRKNVLEMQDFIQKLRGIEFSEDGSY